MTDREEMLGRLTIGDIFHARAPNGASLVCLVTAVTDDTIQARRIHTRENLEFDRNTGIELGPIPSKIDSVAPLPLDIRNTLLAMDRKYEEITQGVAGGRRLEDYAEQLKLTQDERRAHLFLDSHYSSNPV
jgi:hypothetical protein